MRIIGTLLTSERKQLGVGEQDDCVLVQLLSGADAGSAGVGRQTSPNPISWHGLGCFSFHHLPSPSAGQQHPCSQGINLHLFNSAVNPIHT